jgi:hypothetical protein
MPIATVFSPAPAPKTPDEALATYLDTEFGKLRKALAGNLGNRWETLDVVLRQNASGKPDRDYTNNNFLFPQNDTSEVASGLSPLPRAWLGTLGVPTKLYPVIIFSQTGASAPTFKMDYRLLRNGVAVPAYATLTSTGVKYTYLGSGGMTQTLVFPAIDVPGGEECLSPVFDVKVYRSDNVVTGDVAVKAVVVQHEVFAIGSRLQYSEGLSGRA